MRLSEIAEFVVEKYPDCCMAVNNVVNKGCREEWYEEYDTDVSDCIVNCSTCKNNVEFPPPHTCAICTSLDQEEEYGMWEAKE